MKLKILGCLGYMPWKDKRRMNFTSCQFENEGKLFQIDIGNEFKGKKLDYLLISHTHHDHIGSFGTQPKNTKVLIPSLSFLDKLEERDPQFKWQLIKGSLNLSGLTINPFPVLHSSTSLTYGFKIKSDKTFVWITDYMRFLNYSYILDKVDTLFLGASTLKTPIVHKGLNHGQMPVFTMLTKISKMKNPPKKIYLLHYGLAMSPIEVKVNFLKKTFTNLDINSVRDNQIIEV